MQNQSDYTGSVENTNYFPIKGPELIENTALAMEGEERLKKEKKPDKPSSCGMTLIL